MKSNTKGIIVTIAVVALLALAAVLMVNLVNQPEAMDYSTLVGHLQQSVKEQDKKVSSIEISNDTATVKLTNDNKTYRVYVRDGLLDYLTEMTMTSPSFAPSYTVNNRYTVDIWTILNYVMLFLFAIFVLFILFRGAGAGEKRMSFSRSGVSAQNQLKVRFSDVAGAEEEKEELSEIVEFLKAPQKFIAAGARIPKGVLLVGPPGTGKTLFAKAVAGEANVPFFSISGSDFVEMYVGVGASRVRDLFDVAKKHKPCIIFIDEIDAVGRQRGAGLGGGHDEREQTLNQLLVQMDGFETNDDIIIMAATNRADILDPALLRPGRFDRQIYVNVPDVRGREEIFKVHARNKQIAPDVDFKILARITSGFTGADIANLLNEAAILCARANRTQINMADINEGINKVTLGPQKKSRLVTEVDKRITAYHEAGHAIVSKAVPNGYPVHEVSIMPRGPLGGYTSMRPENDNNHVMFNKLTANIAIDMGGRVAEELVIKDISAGAIGDIKHATETARKMVTEWGMSKLGTVYYGQNQEVFLGRDYGSSHSYSEVVAAKIDGEVEAIIASAYKTATDILTKEREKLDVMARILIECETIFADEVDMIMEGKPATEILDSISFKRGKK